MNKQPPEENNNEYAMGVDFARPENTQPEKSIEELESHLNSILGIMRTREEIMSEANAQNMKYKHLEVLLDIRELLINLQTNVKDT